MKTKRFTFTFSEPVKSMSYIINGDDVICDTLEKAKKIIKREYPHARISDWKEREIEIYGKKAHMPNVITCEEDLEEDLLLELNELEDL